MSDDPREDDESSYVGDLRGLTKLVIAATTGITDIVEDMHHTIESVSMPVGPAPEGRTRGVTGLVYDAVRTVTGAVGSSIDMVLGQLAPLIKQKPDARDRVYTLGVLNAVIGDYLQETDNPLAVQMRLCRGGTSLTLTPEGLREALPQATGKLVVFAHGLGINDMWWESLEPSYGAKLECDHGFTSLYLRYNTGRHVSDNGRQLAEQLDALVAAYPVPVEELVLVGYSMGGLVVRSAVHHAKADGFRAVLRHLVFLGTPHHGAALERGGNWVDFLGGVSPYSAPIFRVAKVRSAGITDLRYGSLVESDWRGKDRFERAEDARAIVPLPAGVHCHALAGKIVPSTNTSPSREALGDGLVTVSSALGRHPDPARDFGLPEHDTRVVEGLDHIGMLNSPEVLTALETWLTTLPTPGHEDA